VKVYIKLACVLCIGALWRTTANMAFCYLFWITTLAWVVRYIVRAKVKGGLLVLLGITCDALVTSLNKGVMPSIDLDHPLVLREGPRKAQARALRSTNPTSPVFLS
jgi:hypothetical protein